jgi:hypothetical protein
VKTLRNSLTFTASVLILGITFTLSPRFNTVHAQASADPNVEGTWRVIVTPEGGTPFHALATFGRGGTVAESSAGGDNDKGGQGVWTRTGGRTFGFTLEQFQYNAAGQFLGTFKVRESDSFGDSFDSYSGVATLEFRDPAGNLVFTACARSHATRMTVEAPDCR